MTISIDEVVADLSSFSDSDDAVAVDSAGVFLLERGNEEIQGRLHREGDGLWVEIDDDLGPPDS